MGKSSRPPKIFSDLGSLASVVFHGVLRDDDLVLLQVPGIKDEASESFEDNWARLGGLGKENLFFVFDIQAVANITKSTRRIIIWGGSLG